ncbi:mitogen-activated protein kinase kinase kinase 18 [Actinidia eriantha]|uniref:mitogen-activated protein kinase kinase kinase 18 n=1 Tax=Actinidia eriantha TaxID=165200 RepID=UPI00258EC19A|nr:mitogen-activated protein kinase kinase kinase 18 [Actinidia eriantha]
MGKVNRLSSWARGSGIGRGSFGTVSLAVNKLDGQVSAVKSVELGSCSEARVAALENEIRILRRLSSPWVVEYFRDDVTVEDGATSFRNLHLEYLPGGTVADLAKRFVGDVDESLVKSYTWCVVSALRYVHSLGIMHCDVKGRNVLVGPTVGSAKLADFGSAAEIDAVSLPRGSPLWMAPEVVRGEYQGPESDVWSLGCTVIEMVTGKPAWEDHGGDTLWKIGFSDQLPEMPTQLSELGWDFVGKCLRRDRSERWSCDQLLEHPFISSSAPSNPIIDTSPRCVLDWSNSEFEEEEEEEPWRSNSETRIDSGGDRIGKLATKTGAIWESYGWVMVRSVLSDRAGEVSAACCCGGEEEGTSVEYPNAVRAEVEMGGTSSEYFDSIWTNLECTDSDDGVAAVDIGRNGFTAGVFFVSSALFKFTILICNLFWFTLYLLFTIYLRYPSVSSCDNLLHAAFIA